MRIWLFILLLLPLGVHAQSEGAITDRFIDLDLASFELVGSCGADGQTGGRFDVDEDQDLLTFQEGSYQEDAGVPLPPLGGGESRAVCGWARIQLDVPPRTDHIHVRFDADREVNGSVRLGAHMAQEFAIRDMSGNDLYRVEVFGFHELSRSMTRFAYLGVADLGYFPLPAGIERIELEWFFADRGETTSSDTQSPLSGQSFQASVRDPQVEFSSAVLPVDPEEALNARGTVEHRITQVPFEVSPDMLEGLGTNVRVRLSDDWSFSHVEAPDGARLDTVVAWGPQFEYTPEFGGILVERPSDAGYVQATLAASAMRPHGAGEYTFVFERFQEAETVPLLATFNGALTLIPLLFSALAALRIGQFRREAFGAYKRSAQNLLVALALVVAYYTAVVIGAWIAGWFAAASVVPLGPEAWLLYVQLALATAASIWLMATGQQLHRIVAPSR